MLGLSSYQYVSGRRNSNFAIMCQSVDSRNHFLTSLLVCGGIVLSFFAERLNADWFYYADAVASILIGLFILRSAIQLVVELVKPAGEAEHISHFMKRAQEKFREKLIPFTRLFSLWISPMIRADPSRLPSSTRMSSQGSPTVSMVLWTLWNSSGRTSCSL